PDAGGQLTEVDRLRDVVVRATLEAPDPRRLGHRSRDEDDRQRPVPCVRANLAHCLESIKAWHVDGEEREIDLVPCQLVHRLPAICGEHGPKAVAREGSLE